MITGKNKDIGITIIMEKKFCIQCGLQLQKKAIDGRERFFCSKCSWIFYKNPLPVAVAICYNEEGQLLIIQRGIEPNKGKWSLPGGFLEQGETPEQGCLRELYEETGVSGHIRSNIGTGYSQSELYGSIIFLYYSVMAKDINIVISNEVMQAEFVHRTDIKRIHSDMHKKFISIFYDTELKGRE